MLDPMAVLLADVCTRTIEVEDTRATASEVLARAKERFDGLAMVDAYPVNSDEQTSEFVNSGLITTHARQLTSLTSSIPQPVVR